MKTDPLNVSTILATLPTASDDPFHPDSLSLLPKDVLLTILSLLNEKDLGRMASVSKQFQDLSEDNRLWKRYLNQARLAGSYPKEPPEKAYKQLVKNIYFEIRKKSYIETYKDHQLTPPEIPSLAVAPLSFLDHFKKETLWEKLEKLVKAGDKKSLEKFLTDNKKNEQLLFKDKAVGDGNNLLALALTNGIDIFRILATFFINSCIKDRFFHVEKSRWILIKCIELNIKMSIENSHPIFYAIRNSNRLFNFLIAFNPACLTETDTQDRTPLVYVLELFRNEIYNTHIDDSYRENLKELFLSLLEASYILDKKLVPNNIIQSFLDLLAQIDKEELEKVLQFLNLNNFKTDKHVSALDYYLDSVYQVDPEKFSILAEACRSVINNADEKTNTTVLHKSICKERLTTCITLLNNGADPLLPNTAGDTCLHMVAGISWLKEDSLRDFLILLINHYQANLTTPNDAGETPLQIALKNHNSSFLRIVIKECHASKLISDNDIKISFKTPGANQTRKDAKNALRWTLNRQKEKENSKQVAEPVKIESLKKETADQNTQTDENDRIATLHS